LTHKVDDTVLVVLRSRYSDVFYFTFSSELLQLIKYTKDIFAIHSDVAAKIAMALQTTISKDEADRIAEEL